MGVPSEGNTSLRTSLGDNRLPSASVVVSELNSASTIRNCVESLLAQDYPAALFTVILVDAGSTDGTLDILRQLHHRNLLVMLETGCSESEGQRLGAVASSTDLIFFTNSDDFVPPDWIRRHVMWHMQGYDIVGGSTFQSGDAVSFSRNVRTNGYPRRFPTSGAGFGFGNFSVRNQMLKECGGVRSLPSQQDAEFVQRALEHGASAIIDPRIEVEHDHPLGTLKQSFLRSYGYSRNHLNLRNTTRTISARTDLTGMGLWEVSVPRIICELSGAEPWAAYRAFVPRLPPRIRRPGFVEFLWDRFWGYTVAELVAILNESLHRRSSDRVVDLHGNRAI